MILEDRELKDWDKKYAMQFIKNIEGNVYYENIKLEYKTELCFKDTGANSNNTTQKAVSGFANTYGGVIVFGINNNKEIKGLDKKKDIENYFKDKLKKKLEPKIPDFNVKYFDYKNASILICQVKQSKTPIRCDNGIYYYREQSEFVVMSYKMLEKKFKTLFLNKKYFSLVNMELETLLNYLKKFKSRLKNIGCPLVSYKISNYLNYFFSSASYLYDFYENKNLFEDYKNLFNILNDWVSGENNFEKNIKQTSELINNITRFIEDINKYKCKCVKS
jgi:hypothetical protein